MRESMESKPYVRIFSSSSLSGSFPIRAPPTPDSDSDFDSNSEVNGNESRYISSSSSSSSGYVSAGTENGSEFETASERPLVASDPDEKYEFSCPFVDDPDEFEFEPVVKNVMVDEGVFDRAMPIAQLSWESDDNDVVDSEVEVEDGDFSGRVKVNGNGVVEKLSFAPRVKVEEGEEDEFLRAQQSEPDVELKGIDEGFVSNSFVEGPKGGSFEVGSIEDGGEIEHNGLAETFVHCPNRKIDGVDCGVEGNDNLNSTTYSLRNQMPETLCFDMCGLSEQTKDEDALCSDMLKSVTLSSLSVTLLCELEERNAAVVQFQDDVAYGAKVQVHLEEKDFSIEQEQKSLDPSGEKISITLEEGEEFGSDMLRESLVIEQFEPPMEVNCLEGSEFNHFAKDRKGDSVEAERTEDSVAAAEINEPSSVELNIYVAEQSIVHCPNGNRFGVDASGSFETQEREIHSGTDFVLDGNENQIRDSDRCSQPNPVPEMVSLCKGDFSEATKFDRYEYVVFSNFVHLIAPSSNLTHKHIRDETEVKHFRINGSSSEVAVTLAGQNMITGLKIEDQMGIGNSLVLAGSVGALQFEGDTADGAKLEMRLKNKNFPNTQDRTSLGLSLMKWGGGLLLTTDILSQFSVGSSNMAIHVVLDNNQRGKIAIRASNSDKLQTVLAGILSIAIPIFGFFGSRFGARNSAAQ